MDLEFLSHLKVQTCDEVLRRLARSFDPASPETAPVVEITYGSFRMTGVPVKVQDAGQEPWLALYDQEGGLRNTEALSFVPLRAISSVKILNARVQLAQITEPGAWSLNSADAPSRLEVERLVVDLKSQKEVALDWGGREGEAGARIVVYATAKALKPVFAAITKDPIGKDSFASINKITLAFTEAENLKVEPESGGLRVSVGFKADLKSIESALKKKLEEKL